MSINLFEEMKQILKHKKGERHSFFQLQYFLIGKEPTIQSKMWRCVEELKTRKSSLDLLNLEIEDVNDLIELIDIKTNELAKDNEYSEKQKEIKTRRLKRKKQEYQMRISDLKNKEMGLLEECGFLVSAFKSLENKESLKDYDDITEQKKYWNDLLSQEFNLRELFSLPQNVESLKTILSLSSDSEIKNCLINKIDKVKQLKEQVNKFKQDEYETSLNFAKKQNENLEKNSKLANKE